MNKSFSRDEFKVQCILIAIALSQAPDMEPEEIAEKFTQYHFGKKSYDEAIPVVRDILGLPEVPNE